MNAYTEPSTRCNQTENACAASNADRFAQRLSRNMGISVRHALTAVIINSAAKEQRDE
jgi:hypothetical protein